MSAFPRAISKGLMERSDAPSDSFEVLIQHPDRFTDPEACERALRQVFAGEQVDVGSVTLILCDHETVLELNKTYLQHDYETDVLAFSYSEPGEPLDGEIYVDLDTAAERHEEFAATFEQEVLRYTVHGALHLAGHHDDDPEAKDQMRTLEDRYLAAAGVV